MTGVRPLETVEMGVRSMQPVRVLKEVSRSSLQRDQRDPDKRAKMAGEKRDLERIPLEGEVRGEVMVFQPMTILDISLGGAQIETAFALQLDSLHDFRLSLNDRSIVVKGRIAHCHIGELTDVAALYRTGVEFIALSDHARLAIEEFLSATRYVRTPPSLLDE
jgi:hypothetical protein